MWHMLWPVLMIVASDTAYNLLTKSTPEKINPYFSLFFAYVTAAVAAVVMFFLTRNGSGVMENFRQLNASSLGLGFAILFLETGYIYMYRAGWKVSLGSLVAHITLAVILLVIGALVFRETITLRQGLGAMLCVAGLVFLNL